MKKEEGWGNEKVYCDVLFLGYEFPDLSKAIRRRKISYLFEMIDKSIVISLQMQSH